MMMKKLLVLLLVFGMASVANAAITLSVNGDPAPDDISLVKSQTITLDILLDEPAFAGGDIAVVLSMPAAILRLCSATLRVRWITAV